MSDVDASFRERLRLAAQHLRCAATEDDVVRACRVRADRDCDDVDPTFTPSERLNVLADSASVHFEIARTTTELDQVVRRYAAQDELGFAARRARFDDELIAAILRRAHPSAGDRKFVALVDARDRKEPMAFFSQAHEVAHPLLEPQLVFNFRDETQKRDRWEQLVDRVGAEMVFSGEPWRSAVRQVLSRSVGLSIDDVFSLRSTMARSASTTAVALAALIHEGHAGMMVWANEATSQREPRPVLRILQITPNRLAINVATYIHPKRRVPLTSPIAECHSSGRDCARFEDLSDWRDGDGKALSRRFVWTTARALRTGVLALIDFGPGGTWQH